MNDKEAMEKAKALCAKLGPGWEAGVSVSSERGIRWRAQFGLDGLVVTIVEGKMDLWDGDAGKYAGKETTYWQAGVGYNRVDPHITANSSISPSHALGEAMEKAEKAEKMAKRAFEIAQDMYNRAYAAFEDIQWDEKKEEVVAIMEKK